MKRLATSMASKIGRLPGMGPNDQKMLCEVVKACGFSAGPLAVLTSAIDAKFDESLEVDDTPVKGSNKAQLLLNPQTYATQAFVTMAQGRSIIDVKLIGLAEFLANTLGCPYPHEKTYGAWLTFLLLLHNPKWPKYQVVFKYLNDLKEHVKDNRKKWPLPLVKEFPKVPSSLPENVYKAMYDDTDGPVVTEVPNFTAIFRGHCPLRKNFKKMVQEKAADRALAKSGGHAVEEDASYAGPPPPSGSQAATKPNEAQPEWAVKLERLATRLQAQLESKPAETPQSVAEPVQQDSRPLNRLQPKLNLRRLDEAPAPEEKAGGAVPGLSIIMYEQFKSCLLYTSPSPRD